jgi:hypothetical protein
VRRTRLLRQLAFGSPSRPASEAARATSSASCRKHGRVKAGLEQEAFLTGVKPFLSVDSFSLRCKTPLAGGLRLSGVADAA